MRRNESKKQFRRVHRQALANKDVLEKQKILEARSSDSRLFHRLVNSRRKKGRCFINDLHVGDELYSEDQLTQGFEKHFSTLAQESVHELYDEDYHSQVRFEVMHMVDLASTRPVVSVTEIELKNAIDSINTGKSPDIYNITIENIKHSFNLTS